MKKTLILVFLILGIAFVAQDISYRISARFDLTEKKLYSLSEKTIQILDSLNGSVLKVTVFLDEDEFGRDEAEALLYRYKTEYKAMDIHFVSPTKNPGLVEKYDIGSHSASIWEYGNQRVKSIGLSEEDFSNGILRLVKPHSPIIYFTTGHGEKSKNKELSYLSRKLEEENYELSELLVQKAGGIPENADCLIIAGPKKDFIPEEIRMIDLYMRKGGRVLLLLDPYQDGGFTPLLASYGIVLNPDVVIDQGSKMFGGDELFPMSVEYPPHPLSRTLDGICMFPVARSVSISPASAPGFEVRPLAKTSENTWGETRRDSVNTGPDFDPLTDKPGPLVLAASVEYKAEDPVNDGSLVVFGDSDFITNPYVSLAGNRDLFLNSLAWLTGAGELLGIRTQEPGNHPIILSNLQGFILAAVVLGLLPGIFAVFGIIVWLRRRASP